jgi:hypothetical protein
MTVSLLLFSDDVAVSSFESTGGSGVIGTIVESHNCMRPLDVRLLL